MFNFLEPKLLPKITKKPLCTESYEAENLISKVYSDKLRGFIAYPSTKPPVDFEFEFLCNVNIWYIFLNTSVGNQRCSGVEIFAKNGNSQYVSIGRATYDGQGVIFCNNRRYSKSNPPPSYNSSFTINFFKNGTYKSFLNCSNLKIVIFRTEKSVPCLAAVEVWGIPSKSCSQKTVDTINRLYRQDNETINTEVESKDIFKIYDEFKDDLTYELMTIPYTLPSGKTIDHTTLEKHIASEKSFGRKPCDPFTGVKFTEGLKPILNVGLKSRIDMFLLENSHRPETFHLKRSLRVEHSVSKKIKKNCSIINNTIFNLEQAGNSSDDHSNGEIDFLIQKARADSNFISFTQPSPSTDSRDKICVLCKNTIEYLYELPCEHCYCRNCLLDICINFVCVKCKKTFQRSDVKKIYV